MFTPLIINIFIFFFVSFLHMSDCIRSFLHIGLYRGSPFSIFNLIFSIWLYFIHMMHIWWFKSQKIDAKRHNSNLNILQIRTNRSLAIAMQFIGTKVNGPFIHYNIIYRKFYCNFFAANESSYSYPSVI